MTPIEKLKKSRQQLVTVHDKTFTIRRPTPMEALEWLGNLDNAETTRWFNDHFTLSSQSWRSAAWYAVEHFVDDWQLQEIDILPGGTGAPLSFDCNLLKEWLLDYPAILNGLSVAIFEAWISYLQAREDDQKKLQTGSTTEPSPSNSAQSAG